MTKIMLSVKRLGTNQFSGLCSVAETANVSDFRDVLRTNMPWLIEFGPKEGIM